MKKFIGIILLGWPILGFILIIYAADTKARIVFIVATLLAIIITISVSYGAKLLDE